MQVMIDAKLDRVDLVNEGSCSEAYILMYKGKEGAQVSKERVDAILAKMKPEFAAEITAYYDGEIEKAKCKKSEDMEDGKEDKEFDAMKAAKETAETDCAKAKEQLATVEADLAKAKEEIATLKASEDVNKSKAEPDFDEVLKSAPEAMRGFLTQMKKQNDDLVAKAKAAEEAKIESEAVAKAKELAVLPVDEKELIAVCKSADSTTVLPILEKIAKSLEESGMLDEKGTGSNFNNNDANADIDARAASIAKSKGISIEKAKIEIFREDPKAYEQYKGGAK